MGSKPAQATAQAARHPIFHILSRQLIETSAQIESAVVGVSRTFGSMANRLRESVERMHNSLGTGVDSPASTAIAAHVLATDTLQRLLHRLIRTNELSARAADDMQHVAERFAQLEASLERADRRSRRRATASASAADTVRDHADQLRALIASTLAMLQAQASSTHTELERSDGEVNDALVALAGSHAAMRRAAAHATATEAVLAREIAAAVMALQFQDIVSQRLAHVSDTLQAMSEGIAVDPGAARDQLGHLETRYTMAHERETHANHVGMGGERIPEPPGSVELF